MGTKLNPGKFDCYAAALADEPLFVLLARDPLSHFLVAIWAAMRAGDGDGAQAVLDSMRQTLAPFYAARPEPAKAEEALRSVVAMVRWRIENDGRWRQEQTAVNGASTGDSGHVISVDAEGWARIEAFGESFRQYLDRGCRAAVIGRDPRDPALAVVAVFSGLADPEDGLADSVLFTLSAEGLDALAGNLTAAAEDLRAADRPIDMRQVL